MSEQNKQIVRRYRELHNQNRVEMLGEVVAEDLVSHNLLPGLPDASGINKGRMVHQGIVASFPDNYSRTDALISEGDLVVERWTNTGTFSGAPFMGAPANGKKFSCSGISIYRLENGKIVEHWGEFDSASIMRQLGMLQMPASTPQKV
jgi:steroid delta-isomerase-like uncharacterized protein